MTTDDWVGVRSAGASPECVVHERREQEGKTWNLSLLFSLSGLSSVRDNGECAELRPVSLVKDGACNCPAAAAVVAAELG